MPIPGTTALHRMIFWELLRVFAFSLVGVTGLFTLLGVVQASSQLGLGPGKVFQVVPLLIPSFLPYTIPATVLFASCVAYGRLSNDNEIVAIKAAGVDLYTILWPAFALGVIGCAAVAGVSYSLIPRTQIELQEEIARDPEELLYTRLSRDRTFRSENSPYSIYVRDVQNRILKDVVFKKVGEKRPVAGVLGSRSIYSQVARAREAVVRVDVARNMLIIHADRWVIAGPDLSSESTANPDIEIELPELVNAKLIRSRPLAIDWDKLPAREAELLAERAAVEAKRDGMLAAARVNPDPALQALVNKEKPVFEAQLKTGLRDIRNVRYEYQARPALALSCLAFALVGCPVGIWFNRSDYLSTFVICFIPTIAIYYPLLVAGGGLAKDGRLPMAAGVWLADAAIAVLALGLVWRLVRR